MTKSKFHHHHPSKPLALIAGMAMVVPVFAGPPADWSPVEDVLATRCVACHGAGEAKGGLRLHTRATALAGGEDGPAVVPGDPAMSLMIKRLHLPDDDDERMPPAGKKSTPSLPAGEIALLENWIKAGAPWPEGRVISPRAVGAMAGMLALPIRSLAVFPGDIKLEFPRDRQSFSVLATLADGSQRDLTAFADLRVAGNGPVVASLDGNVLTPACDGTAELVVSFAGHEAKAVVEVSRMGGQRALGFTADVVPIFTRYGCNSGGCHGSARGQDGFHISLFGFDPKSDHDAITRQMIGRRINTAQPDASLLLTKSTGAAPHGGGKRFDTDSAAYKVILDWLKAGAPPDPADGAVPVRVSLEPAKVLLTGENREIALRVRAYYNDGTDRDVTPLAVFSTSSADVAVVNEHGVLGSRQRGEAFVMARFHTFTEGIEVIVVPENLPYQRAVEPGGNSIDTLVGDKLERLRITPSALCSDVDFLRRATIDINGRVPTIEEQDMFFGDTSPDKRAKLVDRLLGRKEFTEIWVMRWAELLQVRTNDQLGMSYKATLLYYNWLEDRIARNVPLDQIVRDLLGATGGTFANPAANFYQSEMDPLKFPENVAQAFLGTRLQCAQCHNHPFDRWTMDDYYGWNAFFTQIGRKKGNDPRETVVFNKASGGVKHPVTKADVAPKFLGGPVPDLNGRDRRVVLAEWLTAPDNPYFSRNIANIVWAHFFGIGIVEPVDDMRLSNPPANPELLSALATRLRESKYDLRDLVRLICNSHTYQRSTIPNATNQLDERNFSRSLVRRMRAEVLHDVLADQTQSRNKLKGLPPGARAVQIADGNVSNYFLTTFGRATRATVCSCEVKLEPNLSQALHLINGETTDQRIRQGGMVKQWLTDKMSPEDIVTLIYRRALCRPPTGVELAKLVGGVPEKPDGQRAYYEDVFWAVLNSKEFVFNH